VDADAWLVDELGAHVRDPEYVVVDELERGVAVVVIEPWPVLDKRGRLRFTGSDRRVSAEVDPDTLARALADRVLLDASGSPSSDAARPLRVGDVFCAAVDRNDLEHAPDEPARWLRKPVLDVSAQAREAAKAQYFAAVGPVLTPDDVETLVVEFNAEDEDADAGA